jgi:predicted transcriptional regulator YheO
LIKYVLLNDKFRDDRVINYLFETPEGKRIRSSSALIRDDSNNVVGMLCINYDITGHELIKARLDAFLGVSEQERVVEEPDNNVIEIIDRLILKIIGNSDVRELSRKRLIELVKFMDDKGIFLVKGAIDKVAELMGVSKVTIYSYLDEAKGKRR